MVRITLCLAMALTAALPAAAQDAPAGPMGPPAPPEPEPPPPTTREGSFGSNVYLDDITYTLRLAWFRTVTVDSTNPDVAYAGSYDGYVWKTVDGGRTWDESRLITERRPFYGDASQRLYFGRHRFNAPPDLPFGTEVSKSQGPSRTDPFSFMRMNDPSNTQLVHLSSMRRTSSSMSNSASLEQSAYERGKQRAAGGVGQLLSPDPTGAAGAGDAAARGATANVNFGIGVPGGAPRLQLLVRKFGKPTSGLNIKQTLLLRGYIPLEVRIIVIHPQNPKVVFACTMYGLFKSYDGGLTWFRTFLGTSPKGKMTFHVAIDPKDGNKVFLATGEGLYISEDGGENFQRSTKKGVGEGVIDWIYFNPYDSSYVFVGTDYGLLRSKDGGEEWEWIYFTTFPDGRVVRSIVIDPFDRKTGYIATHDGLYTTDNMLTGGLESWKRLGGLKFTGIETSKIAACPKHKGHLWALTNMKLFVPTSPGKWDSGGAFVYESLDGGKNWKIIFSGVTNGSMQWFVSDPRDPDLLWLVWSRSMARMKRKPAKKERAREAVILDDPPIGQVMAAAMRYTGTDPGQILDYRWRSRIKALVPKVAAQFLYWRWNDLSRLQDGLYPMLAFKEDAGWFTPHKELRVLAMWDLSDLVFNLNTSLFGRLYRLNAEARGWIIHQIHRLYGELRRLRALMRNKPPKDLRVRVMYKLRMEELTHMIDSVTGNYLTRWHQGGDHPRGEDTKWWERWKVGQVR